MGTPEPPSSPTSSIESVTPQPPSLDDLVSIFIASKRSLSSINQVWRAREIVEAGRTAVEDNAVARARNDFVRYALDVQLDTLGAIRAGGGVVEGDGQAEVKDTVRALDLASARLNKTMEALKSTMVASSFRPRDEEQKNLFDFVDEGGVDDIYNSIKQSMDRYDSSRKIFLGACEDIDADIESISEAMEPEKEGRQTEKSEYVDNSGMSPVPSLFASLDNNAAEVAAHLEGLVKHYDLCVSALRHTEGGGEAMTKFHQGETNEDESKLAGFGLGITKIEDEPAPKALSPEEHTNMLTVLMKDSQEVDDVVLDISDRLADMEDNLSHIQNYISSLQRTSTRLRKAVHLLRRVSDTVPGYMTACDQFQTAWEEEKEILIGKIQEMEDLGDFYTGFVNGYDNMIVEVQRRRQLKREMDKVIRNAMAQLDKLHKADVESREVFRAEHGDCIPQDLWPGILSAPVQYEFSAVGDETDNLPELKKDVVEKAIQRLHARQNAE